MRTEFEQGLHMKNLSERTQNIISKIEAGEYNNERRNECGCSISWAIDGEELRPEIHSDACWVGNILVIDGEDVAQHVYGEGFEWLVTLDEDCDEFEDIEDKIKDELNLFDSDAEGAFEDHDEKLKKTLIDFLEEKQSEGFKLMRDNERGFANEYECILVSPDETDEIAEDWDDLEAEEWASEFLYQGDAMTQAFNSFRLI